MKKIAITGATGFIGANLARRLHQDGHEVHLILRPQYQPWRIENMRSSFKLHIIDLADAQQIQQLLKTIRPQWIFHLAAYGAYSYQKDLAAMMATNIVGLHHLVEAALLSGFESFVNVGSSSEYGFKDHPAKENEALDPNSHYALTKAYASMFCRHTALDQKVNMVTLRPYTVYGPWEQPGRLVPSLIIEGMEKSFPALVSADVARDFIYVDDFVDACILTAQQRAVDYGTIFNVGTGVQTTIKDAAELAREVFSIKEAPRWGSMKSRSWDTNIWVSDSRLIEEKIGFKPKYSFKQGFLETLQWFERNPSLKEFYKRALPAKV